jgi:hypothetical protein
MTAQLYDFDCHVLAVRGAEALAQMKRRRLDAETDRLKELYARRAAAVLLRP